MPYPTQFISESNIRYPSSLATNQLGIKLAFQIVGGSVAKKVVISAKIGGANIKKMHETKLEFFPGIAAQVLRFRFQKCDEDTVTVSDQSAEYLVSWDTFGGIGTGLGINQPDFYLETQSTLRLMRLLGDDDSQIEMKSAPIKINLIVEGSADLLEEMSVLEAKQDWNTPWHLYCDKLMRPQCDFDSMASREHVKVQSGGLVRYSAKNSFDSLNEL